MHLSIIALYLECVYIRFWEAQLQRHLDWCTYLNSSYILPLLWHLVKPSSGTERFLIICSLISWSWYSRMTRLDNPQLNNSVFGDYNQIVFLFGLTLVHMDFNLSERYLCVGVGVWTMVTFFNLHVIENILLWISYVMWKW